MKDNRNGFTVLELLVCCFVLSLLLSILVPAVQRSRESARAVSCKSNLHQIGIGFHSFHESQQALPEGPYPLVRLLPHIGYGLLYEKLSGPFSGSRRVGLYECPSDPYVDKNYPDSGLSSYLLSMGTFSENDGVGNWSGVYRHRSQSYYPRFRDVTDGLSVTSLMGEALLNAIPPTSWTKDAEGQALALSEPKRFAWYTREKFGVADAARFVPHCRMDSNRYTVGPPFLLPHQGRYAGADRGYDHMLPPNSASCSNGPPPTPGQPYHSMTGLSALPASSLHNGGAYILMCDGSARLVSSEVDLDVWGALGTSSEADVVGEY